MHRRLFAATVLIAFATVPATAAPKRNVVIFVADGLRYESVTPATAPTMVSLKSRGVDFTNSHAMYPTVTTVNAASIATGHYPGDTGDYGNTLYTGAPVPCHDNAVVTFLESDCILRDMKTIFGDGYMGQTTLLAAAQKAGYSTIAVGKLGPAAIQNLAALDGKGLLLDDATNHPMDPDGNPTKGATLPANTGAEILRATGLPSPPFPSIPNLTQQGYLASAATEVLLPQAKQPFVLLFWSRDPDATQHSAIESDGHLMPGINGHTQHRAIMNADNDLKFLLDTLEQLGIAGNTDVFVTADHGFSTIAKGLPNADGSMGPIVYSKGFVALDVARWLGDQKMFDPDRANAEMDLSSGDHPQSGDALIGPSADKPMAVVAANGGTDFIYAVGDNASATAARIFAGLVRAPYVGASFVNDALMKNDPKAFAGALPMSAVNLIGSSSVPQPSIVVGFRSFDVKGCTLGPRLCAAEIADTGLHTGQGMHGTFSRADTRNFMAAIGPDFKAKFGDTAPISNADIAPTLAHILGLTLDGPGQLKGRVIAEALKGGKSPVVTKGWRASEPGPDGLKTVLQYQQVGGTRYFDAAGIRGRTVGLEAENR